jgi:transcriptional regulator with XRE-family HTH domain
MGTLPEQLHSLRKAKHLTQQELGERLGWSQGRVSAIENGRIEPRLNSVMQMSRLLDHEVILVPRALLPAVQSMISGKEDQPLWSTGEEQENTP